MSTVCLNPCIKEDSWLWSKDCQKSVGSHVCVCVCMCMCTYLRAQCGCLLEMTLARDGKVHLTGVATKSAFFFFPYPSLPPAVQSIQLLSPQGSRQSIKASGCILLTCAEPLMNSQHDPGWQAGNGCNKDCFCMLFASLINHLAVQQIREPHGNLISHGKGEEEASSGGKRELLVAGSLYFIPPFLQRSSGVRSGRAGCRGTFVFFPLLSCSYARGLTNPTSIL